MAITPSVPADPQVPFVGRFGETAHLVRVLRRQDAPRRTRHEVINGIKALDGLYESARLGREGVVEQGIGE